MERYIPRPRELALERLKAYILEHHLQPGDCLPPERELCRSWGVNRTTLRSAIARLEASGLLYAVQGSGTRIRHRFRPLPVGFSRKQNFCRSQPFHATNISSAFFIGRKLICFINSRVSGC